MTIAVIVLILIIVGLVYLVFKRNQKFSKLNNEFQQVKDRYKDIINVESEVEIRKQELANLGIKINSLDIEYKAKNEQLNKDYQSKRNVFEGLLKEISIVEESLENISFGLYKPHYNYDTSEEFKKKLEKIRERQSALIKADKAAHCSVQWQVGGSAKEGEKMIKQASKLMLRAFNGECDAAISKVSWNNISNMLARIEKAYEAINKLGSTNQISITKEYLGLKLDELRLEFELEEKLYKEREEQRRIKEQMREEEKALREIEKLQKQAEDDELRYQKALEKAKIDLEKATGGQLNILNSKIKELEESLRLAKEQKQRAISQAQLTKSGHVYIISNIGSFGSDVYKIGMTRRLDPIDRVKELGDASVPFDFDVHAIIYSENAPELENILHKKFDHKRVNLINSKREFFNVSIEDIEKTAKELNLDFHITKIAEAKEYRETQSIRNLKGVKIAQEAQEELQHFPSSLN
ncbi:DUF4041 domain-containing protein [Rhodocytophaga rosea]|uniref:DUF4041 domain-containing protein n=1 Tax=Rhodocytophaga rosea TaxID=2704465 RepID=A0A6C0GHM6_9BACT|nr:DUF4041 domain-containing protein [Rhodocytophaga rosea]QHT67405.1 DUF4041 domain-containing protein [Rhodocytophaga rosea]